MTPMDLANLQRVLEAMQTELEDLLRNRAVRAVDPSADMLDQIQRASEHDMEMGNLERESARLREVRAALQRIRLGTFGICLRMRRGDQPKAARCRTLDFVVYRLPAGCGPQSDTAPEYDQRTPC